MSVSLSFDGFNPGFISSLARNPGVQRLRRRSFFTQNRLPDTRAPVICTACPLRWRSAASDPDSASRARRLRRRIYYLARSESCASVRALRIRILSGCVGGFFMPKNRGTIVMHLSYALRARSAGAPPKNRGTSIHKCAFCYFYCSGLAHPAKA